MKTKTDFRLELARGMSVQKALRQALNGAHIIGDPSIKSAIEGIVEVESMDIYFMKDNKRYCMKLSTTDDAAKMNASLAEV